VTRPEEALERARTAASEKRAGGALEGEPALQPTAFDRDIGAAAVTSDALREWAVIDVDPGRVYSTRRLGAPVTLAKRLLLRLLRQYLAELEARQTRFNLAVVRRLEELEDARREAERR
jgi:hypothetical protein